jgi:hypothetical protein
MKYVKWAVCLVGMSTFSLIGLAIAAAWKIGVVQ